MVRVISWRIGGWRTLAYYNIDHGSTVMMAKRTQKIRLMQILLPILFIFLVIWLFWKFGGLAHIGLLRH
jgi:hypothetical protein